jgi:hypothetical protein
VELLEQISSSPLTKDSSLTASLTFVLWLHPQPGNTYLKYHFYDLTSLPELQDRQPAEFRGGVLEPSTIFAKLVSLGLIGLSSAVGSPGEDHLGHNTEQQVVQARISLAAGSIGRDQLGSKTEQQVVQARIS